MPLSIISLSFLLLSLPVFLLPHIPGMFSGDNLSVMLEFYFKHGKVLPVPKIIQHFLQFLFIFNGGSKDPGIIVIQ
jgi:hypothetical protein